MSEKNSKERNRDINRVNEASAAVRGCICSEINGKCIKVLQKEAVKDSNDKMTSVVHVQMNFYVLQLKVMNIVEVY